MSDGWAKKIPPKKLDHERLAKDVEAFLEAGKEIQEIDYGVLAQPFEAHPSRRRAMASVISKKR